MLVLLVVHPLSLQRWAQLLKAVDGGVTAIVGVAVLEDALQELPYLFLVADAILVAEVLALLILVEVFSLALPLVPHG